MRPSMMMASALIAACAAAAEARQAPSPTPAPTAAPWTFSVSAYTYIVPDDQNYVSPTLKADHDRLHLEARYNYEDLNTVSLWAGYMFSAGEGVAVEFTPMLGIVVGDTDGVAPGFLFDLTYRKIEFYSESEYVIGDGGRDENFFYTWSELTYAPVEHVRIGLVAQRTRAYQTDLDVQRGVLAGFTIKNVDLTGHVFNLGWDQPTVVVSVAVGF